jgi:hypothetical protein
MAMPGWRCRLNGLCRPNAAIGGSSGDPDLERSMAKRAGRETIEVPASHAVYISKPNDVARLIERAANASAQ